MAITIRSRQGTQIGYKGTSGGSVSWINQAGQAGRQLASLGNTIINSADNVSKIFDSEVSASEKKQQVDDLTEWLYSRRLYESYGQYKRTSCIG